VIDIRYSKYEFGYIKPQKVKLPKMHDSTVEATFNGTRPSKHDS